MIRPSTRGILKTGKTIVRKPRGRGVPGQELSAVLKQQRATAEVLRVISQSPHDAQRVLSVIAQNAARLCKAKFVALYRYNGSRIHFAAHYGLSTRGVKEMERIYPLKPGQATTVARSIFSGAIAEIPDTRADSRYAAGLLASVAGARSIIAVPMMKNGRPIGSIAVARSKPGRFATPYIKLLETFAYQAVIVIENMRLFEEAQQRNRELSATGDVLKVISRSPTDVQPVFDAVAESAARLCEAYDAIIFVKKGDDLAVGAHHGPIPLDWTSRKISRDWFTGRAVIDHIPMHIHDLVAEGDEFPESRADAMRQGHRTILAVPLLSEGEAIGALVIRRLEVRPFTEKQIELLHTFADQSVIAIKNVRQFEEIGERNRELSEALEQHTATAAVLKVIAASPTNIGPVLATVVESAGKLCEAYDTTIFLREDDVLTVAAHRGAIPFDVPQLPLERSLVTSRAVLDRVPVHVHDLSTEEDEYPLGSNMARRFGFKTILATPLLRQGDAIGALMIRRDYVKPFTQKQIDLLKTFADQAVIAIENVRLFEQVQARTTELSEALEQQTATSNVLKVISRSAFDLNAVFQTLLDSAARLCTADRGVVSLRDGDVLRIVAGSNLATEHFAYEQSHPHPLGRGTYHGRAALEGATIHVPDVLADPEYQRPEAAVIGNFRAVLAVPIRREGDVVGVFGLGKIAPGHFSPRQVELVETFADQAAIAIENVRLFNEVQGRTRELQQSLEYQTATSEVLNVISRSPTELQPVLDVIVETAVKLCEADFGTIARDHNGVFVRTGQYGSMSSEFRELMSNSPVETTRGSITGRTLVEGKVVQVLDAKSDPEYTFRAALEHEEIRTGLGVPLLRGGTPIGAIALVRRTVRPFSEKQIELVTTFADQAVIAIENARLFEEVQERTRELTEALEFQTATSDVLSVISRSPSQAQPVLDAIVATAGHLCQSEYAFIFMRKDDGRYHLQARHLAEPDLLRFLQANPIAPDRATVTGRAVMERRTIHIPDVATDPDYVWDEWMDLSGIRTLLGVPLFRGGDPIGVIAAARKQKGPFNERQIELITTFADQAVIAIENARLFDELQARTAELTESLRQQTATADVLKVISRSTFDLKSVLQTLVESAARLCDAEKATITREIDGKFYRAEAYGFPPEFMEYVRATPVEIDRGSASGRALLEGKVIHIDDVEKDSEYTFIEAKRRGRFRTIIGVPMMREGKAIGVLALTRSEVRPFTDKQIELVSTFADQAAIAIENVRLFESVEARTRELVRSLEDLRAAQDRLIQTEKLASLGQLTAGIAHEIKNPLNFVNNFSALSVELVGELRELIEDSEVDERRRADIGELMALLKGNLDKVSQHGRRADSIVKNMLLHSRQGSGEHRLASVNAIVEESLNLAYHGARAERQGFNITFEKSLDPEAGEVDLYPQEITRALLNLISNGFYATVKRNAEMNGVGYEPTLLAATRNLGDRVEIRIRDNGTGIPAEVKEKIFVPFFTTKPAGEGTGLGLSLSHDIIVKQHAGTIDIDTKAGEFTEFRIVLPRAAASLAQSGGRA